MVHGITSVRITVVNTLLSCSVDDHPGFEDKSSKVWPGEDEDDAVLQSCSRGRHRGECQTSCWVWGGKSKYRSFCCSEFFLYFFFLTSIIQTKRLKKCIQRSIWQMCNVKCWFNTAAGGQGDQKVDHRTGGGNSAWWVNRHFIHHAPLWPPIQLPSALGESAGRGQCLQPHLFQQQAPAHCILALNNPTDLFWKKQTFDLNNRLLAWKKKM